jgi:hypothetical protein
MTEADWLAATDPRTMLEFLRGKVSDRKLRRVSLAILTADMAPDTNQEYRTRMEITSRFADGNASLQALRNHWGGEGNTWPERAYEWALEVTVGESFDSPATAMAISGLLRCIIGNPFRPVAFDPRWLSETVIALATGIYEDRAFDRMPILADGLEEAGCDDADVLTHCRGHAPHVRGCWWLIGCWARSDERSWHIDCSVSQHR